MVGIITVVGFIISVYGVAVLIAPKLLREMIKFFSIGSRLYLAGLLRLILGAILLISSSHCRLWGYVVTMGVLFAASGLSIFFFALKRTKKILARIQNRSDLMLRILTIIALVVWALLIYSLLP